MEGRPVEIVLTPGQQHDCTVAEQLIDFVPGDACLADGSYDSNAIVEQLNQRGLEAVIPSGRDRKRKRRRLNKKLYRRRYVVELFFHSLKRFRRIATRYDKTAACFAAMVCAACVCLWI